MYKYLIEEFTKSPRDVHTVPLTNRPYSWFHVFVEKGYLCIESAHSRTPATGVKKRRLNEDELNTMLSIYHRRTSGEKVSKEAQQCTYSQVYWYGIFAEMNL